MKKMMKKTFSFLLIFMLVFTMIPTSTLKVSAKAAAATTQAKKATTKTAKKTAKKKKKTKAKKQRTVFIAAGHQQRGISSTERLAPGSSRRKAKLTSGTAGVRTHIPEYKTNLAIAKATKKELKKRGYKVIMLRTTNNCLLSNQQRIRVVRISISVFTVMHQEQVREVLWFVFPEVHVMLERRYLTVHAVLEAAC